VVCFHGGLDSPTPADGKNIKGKVLVCHGADDPFSSPQNIAAFEDEMRQGGVDWQQQNQYAAGPFLHSTGAGNDNSKGAGYNERRTNGRGRHEAIPRRDFQVTKLGGGELHEPPTSKK